MRRILAVLAMAVLPVAAQAISLEVKNCATTAMTVAVYKPDSNRLDTQAHILGGQSARLACDADACWMRVTYVLENGQGEFGTFLTPVSTDRCSRGRDDLLSSTELPPAGTCGC